MNGLSLRIVRGGMKKSKNLIGFPPVHIETSLLNETGEIEVFKSFASASSTDEQLAILKRILQEDVNKLADDYYKFLVTVFLLAEAKHPIKCFITRHITKTEILQQPFSEALADRIKSFSLKTPASYVGYMDVVPKLSACLENFPAGAASLKIARVELAGYLMRCLECCIIAVNEQTNLSPTEKNELFSLCHLALRLLLHIVQKGSEDRKLDFIYEDIRLFIQQLVFHEDVPMDTKSLAGILCLTIYIVDKGAGSWVDLFENPDPCFTALLRSAAGRLSLYSAAVTAVPADRLAAHTVCGRLAAVELAGRLVEIGERNSSESPFTLGVTRALLSISKTVPPAPRGLGVIDVLLPFVWGHLDHYLDSVRHLTADLLKNIVRFCKRVHDDGDDKPLDNLFAAVSCLDQHRKSYYVSLTLLAQVLGAEQLSRRLPGLAKLLMSALSEQAVQAAATMTLETLIKSHTKESSDTVYQEWVLPILQHISDGDVDCTVLSLLESLLANLLASDRGLRDTILPHIHSCKAETASSSDLKRVLMLVSAMRKARVEIEPLEEGVWRGLVDYDVLRRAAVDVVDETRILSLSLIASSPRSTEPLEPGELSLLLYHLEHVSHATPNFRQLLQAPLRKFMKRLEDSYKVLMRQKNTEFHRIECYQQFVEDLRSLCYGNLLRGANYSRRSLSLQVLKWAEYLEMEGFERKWREEYIERLLLHLEDSYETNKALALEILQQCPADMLQNRKYSVSLELEDILTQASSMKPTECVSAGYKLELLRRRLPDNISRTRCAASEPVSYALAETLLSHLRSQLHIAQHSIVRAARGGAMYGVLHCAGHLMDNVDPGAISTCELWRHLVRDLIATCECVCAAAACVVNNSSPEGHLPCDAGQVGVADHGNNGGIVLDDGRPVTAQMVLLCAWRSVKEVSLLLGTLSSRLTISSPDDPTRGTLTCDQLTRMGEHFTTLLEQTKHRGAFEQAYVGFTQLLARLWRSREPSLHSLPRQWLLQLMASIEMGGRKDATRRSAGLPFMIQALVTTEVQVQGNPKCFHLCMTTLLRLATHESYPHESRADTRIHCLNILRALFRNSALDESVAGYVGEGFIVALSGFEGDTWAERNASTLAFSALMTRVFGAPRSRDKETVRNKMTGRIFFLRYPQLYDFMMEKLQEQSSTTEIRPVVFPVLVLLSRLYPSSLEGSESALRLAALQPSAAAVALSPVWHARVLAAKAVVPLVSPLLYYTHIESLLTSLQRPSPHNRTHGTLLQLTRLLGALPHTPVGNGQALSEKLLGATWALTQASGDMPDYVVADEFVKVLNMVIWRLPSLITDDLINFTTTALESLLFNENTSPLTFGKEICLSNATYLLLILSTKYKQKDIPTLICNDFIYRCYDVTLAVLNYLLILHNSLSVECEFQEHIRDLKPGHVLENLRECPKYIPTLCKIFEKSKYLECIQKSLKVLTLEENTQKFVVQIKTGVTELSDEIIVRKLFELIENEHENLTHIYLECLSTFVTKKLKENYICKELILDVVRVIFAHSTPDNGEDIREVVVRFLERNFVHLIGIEHGGSEQNKFEYTATLWSTIVALIEDDDGSLRNRTCSILCGHLNLPPSAPARAARGLRGDMQRRGEAALLVVLSLLDFQSEVCMTDEINDECRVFDQNERHNVILEETIWSYDCAERIRQMYSENTLNHVLSICDDPTYRHTIDKLCNNNVIMFKTLAKGGQVKKTAALNPKIELFIDQLTKY